MKPGTARIVSAFLMFVLLTMALPGCAGNGTEQRNNTLPLMIMADDTAYVSYCDALDPSVEIGDGQIIGHISSVVELDQYPSQNGEANFPAASDAPYARWSDKEHPDAVIVRWDGVWYIFDPAE